jgi:hypothetical protein
MRVAFLGVQILDGFATTNDNLRGLIPTLVHDSGLKDIHMTTQYATLFGTMSLYQATKPLSPSSVLW